MTQKVDIREVDKLLMTLESKFEQEFTNIHDSLNRKSNIDDIQFYRKELNFKLDKNELEAFRQDYVEKNALFEQRMKEKNQIIQQ